MIVNRYTFEIWYEGRLKHTHTLVINPSDLIQNEPARVSVVNTFGGAFINDFGLGVISTSIKGTTGYKPKMLNGVMLSGVDAFKDLRNNVYRYFIEPNGLKRDPEKAKYEMKYFKWDTDEFYVIQPYDFQLQQSSREPTLFRYDFAFYHIRLIGRKNNSVSSSQTSVISAPTLSTIRANSIVAADNIQVLLGSDAVAIANQFYLDDFNMVNQTNYPGLFAIKGDIVEVIGFVYDLSAQISNYYNNGALSVTMDELNNKVSFLQAVLDTLKDIPPDITKNMRDLLYNLKLIGSMPLKFKGDEL